jgi:hypothetical protein
MGSLLGCADTPIGGVSSVHSQYAYRPRMPAVFAISEPTLKNLPVETSRHVQ